MIIIIIITTTTTTTIIGRHGHGGRPPGGVPAEVGPRRCTNRQPNTYYTIITYITVDRSTIQQLYYITIYYTKISYTINYITNIQHKITTTDT